LLLLREWLARGTELVGLSRAVSKVQSVHDAWDLLLGDVSQRVNSGTHCAETSLRVAERVVEEASGHSSSGCLSWGGLESSRASDRAEARLRVQALSTRVTVQLATLRGSTWRKALVWALDVLHTMSDLRLGEVLLLTGHEILLLLLSTLECILLVGSQSGAKGRET
jgi:hypothetical protein